MALLQTQRTAQTLLCASFPFNFAHGDTMTNVDGKTVPFNPVTPAADSRFEIIKLPVGAVIVGVGVDIGVVANTSCYASVGTQAQPTAYLNAVALSSLTRHEATINGSQNAAAGIQSTGANIVMSLSNASGVSVGAGVVDVRYYVVNRATEVTGA